MKLVLFAALALASCVTPAAETTPDRERRLLCTGPTDFIPDDDPALEFFRIDEGLSLATRKEALAIERASSCP